MIKKEYKLIPILGSKKELVPHHLIQKKYTHQYGTINPESVRGKQARRYLRDNFDPVSLYLADPKGIIEDHEVCIITLKDSSKTLGKPCDFMEDIVASKDKIIYYQRDLFDSWVDVTSMENFSHFELPYLKFRSIGTENLQQIIEKGGRLWLEMESYRPFPEEEPEMFLLKVRLYEGRPIIHLVS